MREQSLIAYVDRGFGFLKAGGNNGNEPLVTQSLIAPGATLPGLGNEQLTMVYQGITYLVGTTAAKQGGIPSYADLTDAAPINEESRLLYLAALAHVAGQSGDYAFRVVAGLPVDTWEKHREELKALLLSIEGEQVELRMGHRNIHVTITVEDALVIPQPLGSALDFLLDDHGTLNHTITLPFALDGQRQWAASLVATWRWCVLDIGFNTLNTYALDDMEPIRRFSISPKLGMAYAYQLIGRAAGGRSEIEVQELLRQDRLLGHDAAFAELGRQITRLIRSWNDQHFAFYLITGGGAMALSHYILPGEPNKIVAQAPQHANGRGYLKAGMQRWGAAVTV